MLRIGEFARLSRVSIRMLRHYDRLGLLTPARVDPATGYRYYRANQLRTLNRIVALRDLGLGLREIAHTLSVEEDAALRRREEELLAQIESAHAQLAALRARREVHDADIVLRTVPAARVATVTTTPGHDVESTFNAIEVFVAGHRARADRPPLTWTDGASVTVAVPVSRAVPEARIEGGQVVRLRTLPPANAACVVHNGSYGGLEAELNRMLDWLARTGCRPAGPLREVYLRFGADASLNLPKTYLVDGTDPDYVTELQLPVSTGMALPARSR